MYQMNESFIICLLYVNLQQRREKYTQSHTHTRQGIFWALAVLYKINEKDETLYGKIVMTSYYSNHQSIELAVYGGISMLLTIANVICIQVVGVLTLKVCIDTHPMRFRWHLIKANCFVSD